LTMILQLEILLNTNGLDVEKSFH